MKPLPTGRFYQWHFGDGVLKVTPLNLPSGSWDRVAETLRGKAAEMAFDAIAASDVEGRDTQSLLHAIWLARHRRRFTPDLPIALAVKILDMARADAAHMALLDREGVPHAA